MVKDKVFVGIGVVTGACLVAGLSLAVGNLNASAVTYETGADLQFTWEPIITVSVDDNMTINNLVPGSSSDSNIVTVSTSSNSINGYYLYGTVGNSTTYTSTDLVYDASNPSSSNAKFSSVDGNKAAFVNFSDDTWGYSYSKDNGTTWVSGDTDNTSSGYNALPLYTSATGVKLIENTNSNGSTTIKFKIGAKAGSTQVAGLYKNVVNFIGVPKVVTTEYTINYNDPSSAATTMPTPNPQTGTTTDGAVVLNNTTPVRANYIFKGWCTQSTSNDTCSGDTVYPGSTYALGTSAATATVNLYAVWQSNINVCPSGGTCMQNVSTWGSSLSIGDEVTAIDSRDGKEYKVAKLADGNIWMVQNLDFNIVNGGANLDSTNTDVPSNWPDGGNLVNTHATSDTTWSGEDFYPESYDPGDICWDGIIDSDFNSTLNDHAVPCTASNIHYHFGNYYNWSAAVAMAYTNGGFPSYPDLNQSLCPAGWRLPIDEWEATGDKTIYNLVNGRYTVGPSGNIHQSPVYFVYSGWWRGGSSSGSGGNGFYWSSIYGFNEESNAFYFSYDGTIDHGQSAYRDDGHSIRCVAR